MPRSDWPDSRLLVLLGIDVPIVQAPIAGTQESALAIAVSEAGDSVRFPCALLDVDQIRSELAAIRASMSRPVNVNFCHTPASAAAAVGHSYTAIRLALSPAAAADRRAINTTVRRDRPGEEDARCGSSTRTAHS